MFNRIISGSLLIAAALVLAVSSLTTIYYDMGYDEDWPQYGRENIPLLFMLTVLVIAFFYLLYRKKAFENHRGFAAAALLFICAYCLLLILTIRPQAVNDSKTLDNIINAFMEGDYSSLTEPGGYLFIWPFQLGYVFFGQIVGIIFGPSNYLVWDILQHFSILITLYLIYKITWEIFGDRQICAVTSLLSVGALFFYNYVTYIYGDILSMAPQTIALYAMILFTKRGKIRYALISGAAIAVAVALKTNCEITLIALIAILFLGAFSEKADKNKFGKELFSRLLIAAAFVMITFGVQKAIDLYYCNLTGLSAIPEGNPAFSHIAMGLQESDLEDGWYNGYNYKVFAENNYDTAATKAAAIQNIKETLGEFAKRPLHGARFFVRKFTTQWADSVCVSTHNLDLVSRHVENSSPLVSYLVFGSDKGCPLLIWIMNVFMTVCYLGAFIYLLGNLRKRKPSASEMLLLILIFGGILFHEFWEGSSRYAMRYYIYYLPYAGFGLKRLLDLIAGALCPERGRDRIDK